MEGLVGLLFAGIVTSVTFLLVAERSRARARGLLDAARAVGLTDVEETETLGFTTSISGTAKPGRAADRDGGTSAAKGSGLRVRLERYSQKYDSGTRITVGPLGHGPYGFALRREGLGTALEKAVGKREIETGDPRFDEELYVQGQAPRALAVLDAETRREVRRLFRGEIWNGRPSDVTARLAGDLLKVEVRQRLFEPHWRELPGMLSRVLALALRLAAPRDVAARLAANLRGDPEPRVRLECLLTLVREFPPHVATREALLSAREDPNPEVRLRAGIALGLREGRACLLDLAASLAVEDSCAARAVSALGEHLERARVEEILGRALRRRRLATATACLDTLGRWGGEPGVPCLAKVLAVETGDVGAAAAHALGATGAAAAEEPLVRALASEAVDVRIAVARALGRVGSVAAVPQLRDAAERARHRELDRAARQAVAEIQSRLEGAVPGQLSLAQAEGGAGQLSLADEDVDGRVSLVEDQEPVPSTGPVRAKDREPA